MTNEELMIKVRNHFVDTMLLQNEIYKATTDKSIPLDERWELFRNARNCLLCDEYSTGFTELLHCDDLINDLIRYQRYHYADMYDNLLGNLEEGDISQENLDIWREAVLSFGYGSFTYDW